MVKDMISEMSFFIVGFGRSSIKEGQATMLNGDMNISSLMINVQ